MIEEELKDKFYFYKDKDDIMKISPKVKIQSIVMSNYPIGKVCNQFTLNEFEYKIKTCLDEMVRKEEIKTYSINIEYKDENENQPYLITTISYKESPFSYEFKKLIFKGEMLFKVKSHFDDKTDVIRKTQELKYELSKQLDEITDINIENIEIEETKEKQKETLNNLNYIDYNNLNYLSSEDMKNLNYI